MLARAWLHMSIGICALRASIALQQTRSSPRVVLFVTTAMSKEHVTFMKCKGTLLRDEVICTSKTARLDTADVILYVSENINGTSSSSRLAQHAEYEKLLNNWPNPTKKIIYDENPGKQEGAMKAMHVGFSRGLFDGYDWVVRINPDVVIWDEGPLFRQLDNSNISGVFMTCESESLTNADFFAVRPDKVEKYAFADYHDRALDILESAAEAQATNAFESIYKSKKYASLVMDASLVMEPRANCRARGAGVFQGTSDCVALVSEAPFCKPFSHIAPEEFQLAS